MSEIFVHRLDNGLCLLGESLPWLESAAFSLSVPAGAQHDPVDQVGMANLLCEWVQRGAGERDSRRFIEDLERLGVDGASSASNAHISFGGAMPAESLTETLGIYAEVLRQPHLDESQFPDALKVCEQEIAALQDDLAQLAILELKRRHFADPYGRSALGSLENLSRITPATARRQMQQHFHPQGTILSVAGKFERQEVIQTVEELFGDWQVPAASPIQPQIAERGARHIPHESHQTHIGIAFPTVPYRHPDYYRARGAVGVLSDGLSSRLFHEVREVRGLCYTVYASLHSLRDVAAVFAYAGTSAERAQETLDVLVAQLRGLSSGIREDELRRLKVQIRSALVMQQESSRSRAAAIASDWYHLGAPRTLAEVQARIDALTVAEIDGFVRDFASIPMDIVTLGPQPLEIPA